MSEIQSWSATAASNSSPSPDGFPPGMAPSGLDNTSRENMAALARWYKDSNGSLASGGSSNAYTLTPNRTISAYAAGIDFLFIANHANTGAATVNVSALGAKDIRDRDGAALASGDIEIGTVLHIVYDATNGYFRASNLIAGLGAGASNLDSLTDVAISTATSGDLLRYNGSSWANSTLAASLTNASTSSAGIVELATTQELSIGTSQTLAVTPYSLAQSFFLDVNQGLCFFPGGARIIWQIATATASTTTVVQINTTLNNTVYAFASIWEATTTTRSPLTIYSKTSTTVTVHNPNAADLAVMLLVVGY